MPDEIEKMPGRQMVKFLSDGLQYGYAVQPGFVGAVYESDLEYLANLGIIEWRKPKQKTPTQSVLVLKKR